MPLRSCWTHANDADDTSLPHPPPGVSEVWSTATALLGRVYAPSTYQADHAIGLLVLLHGAGGNSAPLLTAFTPLAEATGILPLAPESRFQTWDLMTVGTFSYDVDRVAEAVEYVLKRSRVSASRVWIGGHSDGATYALSLGLANGDHFSNIVAFPAGFLHAPQRHGLPEILLVHGSNDLVLPYANVQNVIKSALEAWGHTTRLITHEAGHGIPAAAVDSAFAWLVPPPTAR